MKHPTWEEDNRLRAANIKGNILNKLAMVNQYFYPKLFKVCHYKMKISVISNGRRPRSPKSRPSTLRSNPGRISTSLKINTEPRYFSIKVIRKSNKKMHNLITK